MGFLDKNPGGYLGVDRVPETFSASGVWSMKSITNYINTYKWPSTVPGNGLQLFLDASDSKSYPGTGTTWYDISGNGRNFTFASTPSFTSVAIKYFSMYGNRLTGPASNSFGINNTSGYTIIMIYKQLTKTENAGFHFVKDGTSSGVRGIFCHATWIDGNVYFDQGGCCDAAQRTSVAYDSTVWSMMSLRRLTSSSTRSIVRNSTVLATNTAAASDINLNTAGAIIGSGTEYGNQWDAQLGGVLVYNRGLSDTELAHIHNVLKVKYGM